MSRTHSLLASAACAALLTAAAQAQSAEEPTAQESAAREPAADDVIETPPIIVSGTRFQTPIDQVGRSVSVITADEIEERQIRTVYDALRTVPGVQVIRSGSFGAVSSVSLRGLGSNQTLVVIDGVEQNDPTSANGAFNFANLDAADIERIEVLRGAQSTLYGSNAIAGVINIVTKDGRGRAGGDFYLEGGSFGTLRGSATLSGGGDFASGRITVSGIRTDGYSSAAERFGNKEDDGYESASLSGKGRIQPVDNLYFDGSFRVQSSEFEFDNFQADADNVGETEEIFASGSVTLLLFDGRFENKLSVSHLETDRLNVDGADAVTFDADGQRSAYGYQATLRPIDEVSLIFGVDYEEEETRVKEGFGATAEREAFGRFALIQVQPFPFLTLNGGIRRDTSGDFKGATTHNASGVFEVPFTGTLLRASYAEGFRAPSTAELTPTLPTIEPANLVPEESQGWDVGVEQPLFGDKASVAVNYFEQDVKNLIGFSVVEPFTPNFDGRFENFDDFETKGVEVSLSADPTKWLSATASYTYTDAVNLGTNTAAGLQPEHSATLDLAVRPTDRVNLGVAVTYNGEEELFGVIVQDYVLVDLRAEFAIDDQVDIFGRVENLTDTDYLDNPSFGTAPISAYGGVKARF
ncbi:MAG: TonB-dependent receptor [Pseudomonadota bacterium]